MDYDESRLVLSCVSKARYMSLPPEREAEFIALITERIRDERVLRAEFILDDILDAEFVG